jgi:hypothetical protein
LEGLAKLLGDSSLGASDSRMPSRVLEEIMDIYEPIVPKPTGKCLTRFLLSDLEAMDVLRSEH